MPQIYTAHSQSSNEVSKFSEVFRFKRSNISFGSQKYEYCHVFAILIRYLFTIIKHFAKGSSKIAMYKSLLLPKFSKCRNSFVVIFIVYLVGSPSRCSRS